VVAFATSGTYFVQGTVRCEVCESWTDKHWKAIAKSRSYQSRKRTLPLMSSSSESKMSDERPTKSIKKKVKAAKLRNSDSRPSDSKREALKLTVADNSNTEKVDAKVTQVVENFGFDAIETQADIAILPPGLTEGISMPVEPSSDLVNLPMDQIKAVFGVLLAGHMKLSREIGNRSPMTNRLPMPPCSLYLYLYWDYWWF
jgi:hypothetical protein